MVVSLFTAAHRELVRSIVEQRRRAVNDTAAACGCGRSRQNYIGRIETGQQRVDLIELMIICKACGTNPRKEIDQLVERIVDVVPRPRS